MSLHKRMETFGFNYHGVGSNNENYRREVNEHKKQMDRRIYLTSNNGALSIGYQCDSTHF